jgi:hypothetical protein
MISNLLDNPTAENISDTKKVIAEIVDLILTDDATSYTCSILHPMIFIPIRIL